MYEISLNNPHNTTFKQAQSFVSSLTYAPRTPNNKPLTLKHGNHYYSCHITFLRAQGYQFTHH